MNVIPKKKPTKTYFEGSSQYMSLQKAQVHKAILARIVSLTMKNVFFFNVCSETGRSKKTINILSKYQ